MHVSSQTVLIAVGLAANGAKGLRGDAVLVMISRDVHIQRMLVFHVSFTEVAAKARRIRQATHPQQPSCNSRVSAWGDLPDNCSCIVWKSRYSKKKEKSLKNLVKKICNMCSYLSMYFKITNNSPMLFDWHFLIKDSFVKLKIYFIGNYCRMNERQKIRITLL